MMIARLIELLLRASRSSTRMLARLQERAGPPRDLSSRRDDVIIESTRAHDMAADPDESFYRAQYWHWISAALDQVGIAADARALDLGCGQGRLALPLARRLSSGQVIGVDMSAHAIEQARSYARQVGVNNVEYRTASIADTVRQHGGNSFDVVLLTEVTFYYHGWRDDMNGIERILKPGGILAVAFRPQYYDALSIVSGRMLEQVPMLLGRRSGRLFGGSVDFTWQTSEEAKRLFVEELRMEVLSIKGVGCCSGIKGDPHETVARPSRLTPDERHRLFELELALAGQVPDAGRYFLSIARKRQA